MGKRIIAFFMVVAVVATLIVCVPEADAGIQTLSLTKQTKEITVGESFKLAMSGVKVSSIKWKSSKPKIASVSKKGVVKGLKAGTANITGTHKGIKFTVKVKVTKEKTTEQAKTQESVSGLDGISIKYKTSGFVTKYDEQLWAITFTLTNKNKTGICFDDKFYPEIYINGVEQNWESYDNYFNNVINGASIDVTLYYKANVGDTAYALIHAFDDKSNRITVCEVPSFTIK